MRRLREHQREALAQQTGSGRGNRAAARRRRRSRPASRAPPAGCSASSRLRFSNLPRPSGGAVCSSTSWRERASSAAIASASARRSGRTTPSASTRRRWARRAARASIRRRPLSSSRASSAPSRAPRRRASSPPTVPLAPDRKSSPSARAGATPAVGCPLRRAPRCTPRSRRPSRRRPALWATIVRPAGQRRRSTCPTLPARVSSSRAIEGALPRRASKRRAARPRTCAPRQSADRRASAPARRCSTAAPATYRTRAPGAPARSRSCHSCSSPPCSSDTSNGPTRVERRATDRHVGAPGEARVGVVLAELERRDRGPLAPAGARRGAFQPGADRAREDLHLGVCVRRPQQRFEPAGARPHVVVHEHHELAAGALDTGVARDVQPQRPGMRLVAGAEALRQLANALRIAGVVDDHDLGARAGRL